MTRAIEWIDSQARRMLELVEHWANINTASDNLEGLRRVCADLAKEFATLGGQARLIDLPPLRNIDSSGRVVEAPLGRALSVIKRPEAPVRVFLGVHMDTVYGRNQPFQDTLRADANTLVGPGVADAKGGIAVMLVALEALERSGAANSIGWEVLINPDEELGSPGSGPLLVECAKRNHIGLVFEPTLDDGSLVSQRKGSGNFAVIVRGRAAHAGRDFERGCNAIAAMAEAVAELDRLNGRFEGLTVNVARVEGGGPLNVVPDLAICRLNVRYVDSDQEAIIRSKLDEVVGELTRRSGIRAEWHGGFTAPPKPLDEATLVLLEHCAELGRELGIEIAWRPSGGVCDGNRLAAAGLANIDAMGARGGHIHSPDEYLIIDSLTERARLAALLLVRLATRELALPGAGDAGPPIS